MHLKDKKIMFYYKVMGGRLLRTSAVRAGVELGVWLKIVSN